MRFRKWMGPKVVHFGVPKMDHVWVYQLQLTDRPNLGLGVPASTKGYGLLMLRKCTRISPAAAGLAKKVMILLKIMI